uniref:Uncharacterized protein n=1 Tax=Romanomermis culicivorax TaxID=13658 RepID=A0A915L9C7_ROMCU
NPEPSPVQKRALTSKPKPISFKSKDNVESNVEESKFLLISKIGVVMSRQFWSIVGGSVWLLELARILDYVEETFHNLHLFAFASVKSIPEFSLCYIPDIIGLPGVLARKRVIVGKLITRRFFSRVPILSFTPAFTIYLIMQVSSIN